MEVSLKTKRGKILEVDLPEDFSEVKLSQVVDFATARDKMVIWEQEQREAYKAMEEGEEPEVEVLDDHAYLAEYLRHLLNIVAEFTRIDIDGRGTKLGSVEEYVRTLGAIREGETIDFDSMHDGLFKIYTYIFRLLKSYEPKPRVGEEFEFEYKGDRWKVPGAVYNALKGRLDYEDSTVGRMVEALEVRRAFASAPEDPDGSRYFTMLLAQLAAICRCEKYPFPYESRGEIERYLDRMTVYFQDIPAAVALDLNEWLVGHEAELKRHPRLKYYFDPPVNYRGMDSEQRARVQSENEARFKRFGYRYIINRLVGGGGLKTTRDDGTPMEAEEAARRKSYRDALERISDENAMG